MSTGKNIRTLVESGSPIPTQNHSPEQPYYSLDAFYATLLSRTFVSSTEAIAFCRDLCSTHGFTVKQEQSTHKNIYVYCSREGLPDSHRNPKVNPQRNRQSQRCECRWRIVLFENLKTSWEFRKSQNAEAFIHNHALLRPDEIKKEWPRQVSEKIFELARQRLPTNEIRQQVREQYPDISWDDRRFYNRLSEERQKMKQRDTAQRTLRLVNRCAQICMVNAGSEDLSHYVESKLMSLLQDTCKFANINSNSIGMPMNMAGLEFEGTKDVKHENEKSPKKSSFESSSSSTSLPKGYLAVPIPEHTYHVKMYSQNSAGDIRRAIFDMQRAPPPPSSVVNTNPHLQYVNQPRRRRSRALFAPEEDTDSMDLDTPPRKLSRQVTSSILNDDELDDMSSQSSPSNSQALLFANTNADINYSHPSNVFYNSNADTTTTTAGGGSTSHAYLSQSDLYPPSRPIGQGMYDPNTFVTNPTTTLHERPHSMTFGAPILRTANTQAPVRPPPPPPGYPPVNFTQLQSMIEENDSKSRYYPMVPPTRQQQHQQQQQQQQQHQQQQQQQQQHQQHQQQQQESFLNEQMFPSTSSYQPHNVFPPPPLPPHQQYMTPHEQLLQQQQKRKQQYYQQQLERQHVERQQDQQLYRRASGPG